MPTFEINRIDFTTISIAEDDEFEFRSSLTPLKELAKKLTSASSGFANSCGGVFIAGVDGNGDADGGFARMIGRQDLRDWADQVINQVEPTPTYEVALVDETDGRVEVGVDSVALVVSFRESHVGPYMASDRCYYIRAGAHTVKARHFIVDALLAKRHFAKPRLVQLFESDRNCRRMAK